MPLKTVISLTAPLLMVPLLSTTSAAIYSGMTNYTMNTIDATDRARLSICTRQLAPYKNTPMTVMYTIDTQTNQQVAVVQLADQMPVILNPLGISGEYDFGRYGSLPSWDKVYSIIVKFPFMSNDSQQPDIEHAQVSVGFSEQGNNICLLTN